MSVPEGSYDLVIAGAGAAGLELARIASRAGQCVLLIEAGRGSGRHLFQRVPLLVGKIIGNPAYVRHLQSVAQAGLNGRATPVAIGQGLGGSSRVNGNVAVAGPRARYERVLPFWDAGEIGRVLDGLNRSGDLDLTPVASWTDGLSDRFVEAAQGLIGAPDAFERAEALPVNTRGRLRFNHFDGYRLNAAHDRVTVLQGAQLRRVEIDGTRVTGVVVARDGREELLPARDVVLAGGAVGSVEMLMRSGIGDAAALAEAGLACRHELPAVGQHLKDHANVRLQFAAPGHNTLNQKTRQPRAAWEALKFLLGSEDSVLRGPGASVGVNFGLDGDAMARAVRLQLVHFTQDRSSIADKGITFERAQKASIGMYGVWPRSEGFVRLTREGTEIDPGFLHDSDDLDAALNGLSRAREVLEAMGLAPDEGQTEAGDAAFLRGGAYSGYHLIGSCRMGPEAGDTVVGPDFRVHGVDGLSVVDASVMPDHLSTHSYLPSVAMARFAALARGWEAGL